MIFKNRLMASVLLCIALTQPALALGATEREQSSLTPLEEQNLSQLADHAVAEGGYTKAVRTVPPRTNNEALLEFVNDQFKKPARKNGAANLIPDEK